MPVEVKYTNGKSPEQRIADRLKVTCTEYAKYPLQPDAQKVTDPTRAGTDLHFGGSQGEH